MILCDGLIASFVISNIWIWWRQRWEPGHGSDTMDWAGALESGLHGAHKSKRPTRACDLLIGLIS